MGREEKKRDGSEKTRMDVVKGPWGYNRTIARQPKYLQYEVSRLRNKLFGAIRHENIVIIEPASLNRLGIFRRDRAANIPFSDPMFDLLGLIRC